MWLSGGDFEKVINNEACSLKDKITFRLFKYKM